MRVVICGAGVIGAAVAYFLSRRGVGATLVERTGVACAASGKSGGFIARDWCDGQPQQSLARLSFELHAELAQALAVDYGYRRMQTLSVVASELRDVSAWARVPVPGWLDPTCAVDSVIGEPDSTAQVDPARFTATLVDAATAAGATLRRGCVDALLTTPDGGRVRGVTVDGGALEADAVVIAMGPWSDTFRRPLGLPRIDGLKGYSILLQPTGEIPAQALFVEYEAADGTRPSPEIVPRADGRVWLCGMPGRDALPRDAGSVSVDAAACDELARIAARISPALREARVVATQACYRPICADAMPLIGCAPGVDGAFVATAHNCWGMLNAPATGLAMSELLLDGHAGCLDLAPFAPARL